LPLPTRNYDVVDANGDDREIDLCYVARRGALECDGQAFHSTATQTEEDAKRQAALEAVGFTFVRVTWWDAFHRPEWVVDQVRSLLGGSLGQDGTQIRPEKLA
jgi:very-short-patch-repair endonuclease